VLRVWFVLSCTPPRSLAAMGSGVAWWQILAVVAIVLACYRPLGEYMARVYTATRHTRAESAIYRLCRIDPDAEQEWPQVLARSAGLLGRGHPAVYAILRLQSHLPFATGHSGVSPALSFNTRGELLSPTPAGRTTQASRRSGTPALAAGLGVAAFSSACSGAWPLGWLWCAGWCGNGNAAIAIFWVDLVRGSLACSAPDLSLLGCHPGRVRGHPEPARFHLIDLDCRHSCLAPPGGPVASWEPIKLLSGDGGRRAEREQRAYRSKNPGPVSNVLKISMMLLIPVAFIRTFGRLIGNQRPAWALLAVAAVLFAGGFAATAASQAALPASSRRAVGAATEGTETRFGVLASAASVLQPRLVRMALPTRASRVRMRCDGLAGHAQAADFRLLGGRRRRRRMAAQAFSRSSRRSFSSSPGGAFFEFLEFHISRAC